MPPEEKEDNIKIKTEDKKSEREIIKLKEKIQEVTPKREESLRRSRSN